MLDLKNKIRLKSAVAVKKNETIRYGVKVKVSALKVLEMCIKLF